MKIINDTFYYDKPFYKNHLLGTMLVLCVLGFVTYLMDRNYITLLIFSIFLFQLLFSLFLIITRERLCRFTDTSIEFRCNFIKPLLKINAYSIKSLEIEAHKFIFHLVNYEKHVLSFSSKHKNFFHDHIKTIINKNNTKTSYKFYFKSGKTNLQSLINNFFPMIMLVAGTFLTGKKSLDDISSILYIIGLTLFIIGSIYVFINRKFIQISAHNITLKKNLFRPPIMISSTKIKSINESKDGIEILIMPDIMYTLKSEKKIKKLILKRLVDFCDSNHVNRKLLEMV